jgi:uncharacterized protein involved in exopolysaccharide biosynthesis
MDYLEFLRRRYRFILIVMAAALATAALACWLLPRRYTATSTVLIDPPGTGDPRLSTAVSPAYLESLKSFEQFASSDSLFLKACQKFNLLDQAGSSSVERFKQRVLNVEKPKDTRLLRIAVTLRDSKLSQAVAQYIAEQAVLLNRGLAQDSDQRLAEDAAQQTGAAKAILDRARETAARLGSVQSQLEEETLSLRALRERARDQALQAGVEAAELTAQETALKTAASAQSVELDSVRQRAAGARARQVAINANQQEIERRLASRESALADSRARVERAEGELATTEATFNELSKRANDLMATSGLRSEQLRIIDPGIVPQRPSFPDVPLTLGAAFALSLMAAVIFLTLQFRLAQTPARPARAELRVARGGR